jgi:hypothetical protein
VELAQLSQWKAPNSRDRSNLMYQQFNFQIPFVERAYRITNRMHTSQPEQLFLISVSSSHYLIRHFSSSNVFEATATTIPPFGSKSLPLKIDTSPPFSLCFCHARLLLIRQSPHVTPAKKEPEWIPPRSMDLNNLLILSFFFFFQVSLVYADSAT